MSVTLYLLRHGESLSNARRCFDSRIDAPLSPLGERQAAAQAERLQSAGLQRVLCSSLGRAQQTARAVAALHGLTPEVRDDLREIHVGALDGLPYHLPEHHATYKGIIGQWEAGDHAVPFVGAGGESLHDATQRLTAVLQDIESCGRSPCLIVAHALLYMALFWCFSDRRTAHFDDGYITRCGFAIATLDGGRLQIQQFNVAPELPTGVATENRS